MAHFSTREAAKKLGLSHTTLARYIETGKVPAPKTVVTSSAVVHLWTQEEIENVLKLLPKIANGRKTRYKKKGRTPTKKKSKHLPAGRAGVVSTERSPNHIFCGGRKTWLLRKLNARYERSN